MELVLYLWVHKTHNEMIQLKNFSKTYYTDNMIITIRIKRDMFDSMGCRLTIKERTQHNIRRIVYTQFYNDKDMFRKYYRGMLDVKIPRTKIEEIMEDVKSNLKFEKVVTLQPINVKMFWE